MNWPERLGAFAFLDSLVVVDYYTWVDHHNTFGLGGRSKRAHFATLNPEAYG